MPKYYEIAGGHLWDVDAARFVDQAPDGAEIISLYAGGKPAGVAYLRRTLEFYGYTVGPELLTLEELKAAKLAQINEGCQSALAALTATYPTAELLTFDRQEAEARSLLADTSSQAPFLTSLATARGISVTDLAHKVIVKADLFSAASAFAIGQRQRYEDLLKDAKTKEAVAAIQPVYTLPEVQA
ncbi:hypothetical protein [Desulfovibrio piger]|uniref:hypothetical protein n=1 Tax=Desulfovibrio piger TaxID=901 RepID=UPI0030769CC8